MKSINEAFEEICLKHKYIRPVNRASDALYIILKKIQTKSKKIAISEICCHDILAAVIEAGWEPFLVDISPKRGSPSIKSYRAAIHQGCSVILVTNLYGNPENIKQLSQLCAENKVEVIEDLAQSLGAKVRNKFLGTFGKHVIISFGKTKQFPIGNGLLMTNNEEIFDYAKAFTIDKFSLVETPKFRKSYFVAQKKLFETNSFDSFKNIHKEIKIKKIKYDLPKVKTFKQNLKKFKNELSLRRERFLTLKEILEKKGFNIGFLKEGAIPWRLNCWYGNRNYLESKEISDNLRKKNIRVSHWYIPLSAFLSGDKISCEGAKMFNKGLIQFWLDKRAEEKEYNLLNKIIM